MLKVTCHECHSQYQVDETKINGRKAKFKCTKCSQLVSVNLEEISLPDTDNSTDVPLSPPESSEWGEDSVEDTSTEDLFQKQMIQDENEGEDSSDEPEKESMTLIERLNALTIGSKFLLLFLTNVIIIGGAFSILYMIYIPSLLKQQIDLRTYSVAQSFSAAVMQPYLLKNYLRINQTAEMISRLPGVAYASVVNNRGIAVAGIFGQKDRFEPAYVQKISTSGFPKELSENNRISKGTKKSQKDLLVGGRRIVDVAIAIDNTGDEVHVGMFTEDIRKAVKKSLIPLGLILFLIAVLGSIGFIYMANSVSKPIQSLITAAEKISVGDLESPIDAKGGREIAALAKSLERMRFSIHFAINRLRAR